MTAERSRPSSTARSAAAGTWAALRPEDSREATLLLGLAVLGIGLLFSPWPWLSLVVPGAILVVIAMAAYLLPRREP